LRESTRKRNAFTNEVVTFASYTADVKRRHAADLHSMHGI